jgi:hypothetical protein
MGDVLRDGATYMNFRYPFQTLNGCFLFFLMHQLQSADHINTISTMSYKAGIIAAITELKDRTGSSSIAIKKHMQDNIPADKKWMNGMFLKALKDGVAAGDFIKVKASYKLSAAAKTAAKKKAAPKKKPAPKKKVRSVNGMFGIFVLRVTCVLNML